MNARSHCAASVGLAVFLLAGCAADDGLNHGGELSGRVVLDGKPLGGGRVEVYSQDGRNTVACQIRPDGAYTVSEPPLGPCKIVVKTSQLRGSAPAKGEKGGTAAGVGSRGMTLPQDVGLVFTPIPAKYEELTTTDLAVTVEKGQQAHEIKLTR